MVVRCCCMAVLVMFASVGFFVVAFLCLSIYISLTSFTIVHLRPGDVLGNTRRLQEKMRQHLHTDTPHLAFLVSSNQQVDVNLNAVYVDINSFKKGRTAIDEKCKGELAKAYAALERMKRNMDALFVIPHSCLCEVSRPTCLNVPGSRIMIVVAFHTDLAIIIDLTWICRLVGLGKSSRLGMDEL